MRIRFVQEMAIEYGDAYKAPYNTKYELIQAPYSRFVLFAARLYT